MADKLTKLSQAIRLGATFHPQCFGTMWNRDYSTFSGVFATCAVGAAIKAINPDCMNCVEAQDELCERFNIEIGMIFKIAYKNDTEKMSREQIADWLEQQGL